MNCAGCGSWTDKVIQGTRLPFCRTCMNLTIDFLNWIPFKTVDLPKPQADCDLCGESNPRPGHRVFCLDDTLNWLYANGVPLDKHPLVMEFIKPSQDFARTLNLSSFSESEFTFWARFEGWVTIQLDSEDSS